MNDAPDIPLLREELGQALDNAHTKADLEIVKIAWLGRTSGRLTHWLKTLGSLPIDQKKVLGPQLNQFKIEVETLLAAREAQLRMAARAEELTRDNIDLSLPGTPYPLGHRHPLTQVTESLVSIFRSLGFVCADGPEMETEFHNFEALNVPADHPARDMQDTFYLKTGQEQLSLPQVPDPEKAQEPVLLRTHTSPVQVRIMQNFRPPIAVVVPGRVYRHEAVDATHSAIFHQLEGLVVDEGLSFADLKGTLTRFAQLFFAAHVKTRFKPSFFPFTEPSAQMDVSCWICSGSGCRTCKQSGWIEILGAGMVNPAVFAAVNIDAERYTGFAFGMGIERLAMIKYDVQDMRLFYENDLRFLQQF